MHAEASVRFEGSSPRVRGKRAPPSSAGHRGRLIPARAGKTRKPPASPPPETAHPRACGENDVPAAPVLPQLGSSPRVRGKRGHPPGHRVGAGLIPARAGKTGTVKGARTVNEAHPRACGENGLSLGLGFRGSGSSPRVRENRSAVHDPPAVPGSSPRVRGKRPGPQAVGVGPRLIPACAGKTRSASAAARAARAHPRVCGENDMTRRHARVCDGSSPRVRGKRARGRGITRRRRLIPACAGKTPGRPCTRPCGWAHPRVCGENNADNTITFPRAGSSPRVRGKPPVVRESRDLGGLIPACAGKTSSNGTAGPVGPAHPRVCGENGNRSRGRYPGKGSSPRVRGKRTAAAHHGAAHRLIPACAGKTPGPPSTSRARWAHPRVCGENDNATALQCARHGSSPRVRGKLDERGLDALPPRLIPACAGKTPRPRCGTSSPGAHPRVCGENLAQPGEDTAAAGSSPRVRGKLLQPLQKPLWLGLIPACAGKTSALGSRWRPRGLIPACAGKTPGTCARGRRRAAHPRVCGENSRTSPTSAAALGSSPRVRGKPLGLLFAGIASGLIPACAGKTRAMRARARSPAAHPRVCGENVLSRPDHRAARGSSPRVRGKPLELGGLDADGRLIPACAGKTRTRPHSPGRAGAHPRVCGENLPGDQPPRPALGSSPRVRGKRGLQRRPRGFAGLIPACAGKTPMQALALARFSAHPRVCGENALPGPVGRDDDGSSPRVRGKPALGHTQTYDKRLIPACAGKT